MTRARIALAAVGVGIGLVGAYAFVTGVPSGQWLRVLTWLGGAVVAHDVFIAPAAVLLGLAVFRVLPARLRPPARVSALAAASLVLIAVPLLMTR